VPTIHQRPPAVWPHTAAACMMTDSGWAGGNMLGAGAGERARVAAYTGLAIVSGGVFPS
jgi:hypothetical protein